MPTCKYCGEEIEFRYVNGRCVPIHPDGGWQCSWSQDEVVSIEYLPATTRDWHHQDFTRPSHCPKCGANVFFIRHNGGSVWLDELGWPWPKHACFDQPNSATSEFARWSVKASGFENAKIGVITCVHPPESSRLSDRMVEIKLGNGTKIGVFLQWMPADDSLTGALVCVSTENKLLLHEKHGEIAFHRLVEVSIPPSQNAIVRCPRCNAFVIRKNMDKHKKSNCTNPEPPRQRPPIK